MNLMVKRRMKNRSINFEAQNLRLEVNVRNSKKMLNKEKISEELSSG